MGGRRGRRLFAAPRAAAALLACAAGALALGAAGCGVEEHANESRPQPPTRVSVAVGEDGVTVEPRRIAFGPEPTQRIPQNRNAAQPRVRSGEPLDVVLVAANLTDVDSRLEVRGAGRSASSPPLYANSNVSMLTALPAGVYRVSAAGIPELEPARLVVGPYRSSSENDVLLP